MGTDSFVVERCFGSGASDQCSIGNCGDAAGLPRLISLAALPNSGGRILRVAEARLRKTAVLLRSGRWGTVRICRSLGSMERSERTVDPVMLDLDDDTECSDLTDARSNARDSRCGQL